MIEVDFPPGCCGLLHVQIFDGLYQVLPASPGESLNGDSSTLYFDDLYFKTRAPFELTIRTWNNDDLWEHTTQVRIGVAVTRAEMSRYIPAMAYEDFEKLLAETISAQEAVKEAQIQAILKGLTE
uniref:Uncharacterized protein n=2 Tax=viral metagenome TaxID=1070528 RepID=A0A6M3IG83_9ZZZZ